MTRLVAVLHRVCAARLARAMQVAGPDDVVLFSGWARRGSPAAEADLMAEAWKAPVRARIVDRHARTTLGNALSVARLARKLAADEVVLVTSSWHARRAGTLLRAALSGSGSKVEVVTSDERPSSATRLRELACWLFVPVASVAAGRSGRDTRADGV